MAHLHIMRHVWHSLNLQIGCTSQIFRDDFFVRIYSFRTQVFSKNLLRPIVLMILHSRTEMMTAKRGIMYLEQAILPEKTDRTSLVEDSLANNFPNASKVDASEGTSKHNELKQYAVMHATLFLRSEIPFCKSLCVSTECREAEE